ncbi:MAG: energy transducer TonB [Nitrosospira sp.]|nr:energy transducer TonB [Nitrosospira sp.]
MVLFGITVKLPLPIIDNVVPLPLEVVLVSDKSASKPRNADALAHDPSRHDRSNGQTNPDSGGNINRDRRVKTPFPLSPVVESVKSAQELGRVKTPFPLSPAVKEEVIDVAAAMPATEQLEQEAERLMTAVNRDQNAHQAESHTALFEQNQHRNIIGAGDLVQRSLEIARLEAQTVRDYEVYQKRPQRRFIGARTNEYRFARYVEDWRVKVERIGNLNYPEAARRERLFGNLQLTVGIKSDGSVESVEINRSSGQRVLDEAAIRIVKLAGQNGFAPFPPDISRDTDILHITRIWAFTREDGLTTQ